MKEVRKKSVVPVYGLAFVWLLYCLIFPLYRSLDFLFLLIVCAAAYTVLSRIFPGKTEYIKEPEKPVETGNTEIDALLREGETAVSEMRAACARITDARVKKKVEEIIAVTDKIFKNLLDDPSDYRQVKRFSEFYLPTTIKLLHAYDRLGKSGVEGENITGTIQKIDDILDTIIESYKKFFDSLFENQALDIETDIQVLESMMKKEGLYGKDF